jgi:hypothetical protein
MYVNSEERKKIPDLKILPCTKMYTDMERNERKFWLRHLNPNDCNSESLHIAADTHMSITLQFTYQCLDNMDGQQARRIGVL